MPKKNTSADASSWRDTVREGDTGRWQATVPLPIFAAPYIHAECSEDGSERKGGGEDGCLREFGGESDEPTDAEVAAIDYLIAHEQEVFDKCLKLLAEYGNQYRGYWEGNEPECADKVAPENMTPQQASERIVFTAAMLSDRDKDGFAYVQLYGECAWDPEHGFCIVMHRSRVLEVFDQGTGWEDHGQDM